MGFILKLWILLTVVYIGPSNGDEGIVKRSFTVTSPEEVESIMQELLQETCMSAPKAETSSTPTTTAQSYATKTSKQTSAGTTPSTSTRGETTKNARLELTNTPQVTDSTIFSSTSTRVETTTGATLDLTSTPQVTDSTIPSSTSTVDITTKETTTSLPTTISYDSTDEPTTPGKGTTDGTIYLPLGSVHSSCGIVCGGGSVRHERNTDRWVGKKIIATHVGNFFCGCTCKNQQCLLTELVEDCQYIVVQRRVYGNVTFDKNYTEYEQGFGDMTGDYWIGLEKLHKLTERYTGARLAIYFKAGGNGQVELESANNVSIDAGNYRLHYDDVGLDSTWNGARERTFLVSSSTNSACGKEQSGWWGDAASDWCNPNSEYKNNGVLINHPSVSGAGQGAEFIEIRLYLSGQSEASCPKKG